MLIDNLRVFTPVFANDNSAYDPILWAQESLMQLEANMVVSALVHRDFSKEVAAFGHVVNTRKPRQFEARRKVDGDAVTEQDASATNVAVKLDQHIHTSFLIYDIENSNSFQDLISTYLEPAARSLAQMVDEVVLGAMYEFVANSAGKLQSGLSKATIISAQEVLDTNKCPSVGRSMIVGPSGKSDLLNISEFINADKIGDDGTALREGSLGDRFGFKIYMDQNSPSVKTGGAVTVGAINNAAGYSAGDTALTVDVFAGALAVGTWVTVAGDMTPQRVTASTTTTMTITPGFKTGVADDAVVTSYDGGQIDLVAGYASGYGKAIVADTFTTATQQGQLVSLGADIYSAVGELNTTTSLTLNRPLENAAVDNAVIGVGPAGDFGLAFHRNAISLVVRPLPAARGVESFVASFKDLSMRVTIDYDSKFQATRVTLDMLCGVKVLDTALGCLIYG